MVHPGEQEIYQGILAQDLKILNYCYKTYGVMIRNWIKNQGGSGDDADDLFQESMIALYTNIRLGKFELSRAKISSYLVQIAKYKWLDQLRSSRHQKTTALDDKNHELADGLHEDHLLELEHQKLIHQALNYLNDQCRAILHQFYWEKKSLEEIALQMQMQVNSVKNGKYRCMQSLRDHFQKSQSS